jgi:hypothetical protein
MEIKQTEKRVLGKPTDEELNDAVIKFLLVAPRVRKDMLEKIVEASYQKGYMICLSTKLFQEAPGDLTHVNWTFGFNRADIYPSLDEHARLLAPQVVVEPSEETKEAIKGDFETYKEEAIPGEIIETTKNPVKDELDVDLDEDLDSGSINEVKK